MKKAALFLFLLGYLIAGIAIADEPKDEPKYDTNAFYFDKVTVKPGEHFAVNVYLFNVDTLCGMQVPIFYRSGEIKLYCDSVSFVDSRCKHFMFNDIKIPENDQTVYFSFIESINPKAIVESLYPGDGIVATVYFTAPEDCEEGTVKLTRGMIPHPQISFTLGVWDKFGTELDIIFEESEITIKK